jgi:hypothetical protein
MARLASRYNDEEDDYFGKAMDGIKTGINIGNAINQKKLHDAQMERHNYQFEEEKANRGVRDDMASATRSKANKERVVDDVAYRNALGTALSDHTQNYILKSNDNIETVAANHNDFLSKMSGGKFSMPTRKVVASDGSESYVADVMEDGKVVTSFGFHNKDDLAKNLTAVRTQGGYFDNDTYMAMETMRALRAKYKEVDPNGDFDTATKADPGLLKKLYNMVGAKQTATQYDEEREKHGWTGERHDSQMATDDLQRKSINQSMGHASATRAEAAERHQQWRDTVPLENQKALTEVQRGSVAYLGNMTQTVASMYPPDVPQVDELKQPTGEYTYSPQLASKIRNIATLASKADPGMNPIDAIIAADKHYTELEIRDRDKEEAKAKAKADEDAKRTETANANKTGGGSTVKPTSGVYTGLGVKPLTDDETREVERQRAERVAIGSRVDDVRSDIDEWRKSRLTGNFGTGDTGVSTVGRGSVNIYDVTVAFGTNVAFGWARLGPVFRKPSRFSNAFYG